jgi:hypothetical protein
LVLLAVMDRQGIYIYLYDYIYIYCEALAKNIGIYIYIYRARISLFSEKKIPRFCSAAEAKSNLLLRSSFVYPERPVFAG